MCPREEHKYIRWVTLPSSENTRGQLLRCVGWGRTEWGRERSLRISGQIISVWGTYSTSKIKADSHSQRWPPLCCEIIAISWQALDWNTGYQRGNKNLNECARTSWMGLKTSPFQLPPGCMIFLACPSKRPPEKLGKRDRRSELK